MASGDIYYSCDVEADGPIPGPYSMTSIGFAIAGTFDGKTFTRHDPTKNTFYAELKPISDTFQPSAMEVSGLDREDLVANGEEPVDAMKRASAWIDETCGQWRPVFVGYPVVFDWMFVYWYFMNFAERSPFGFSSALDMKTFFATRLDRTITGCTKRNLPKTWLSKRPHTHNALDDAIEQADLFANAWEAGSEYEILSTQSIK